MRRVFFFLLGWTHSYFPLLSPHAAVFSPCTSPTPPSVGMASHGLSLNARNSRKAKPATTRDAARKQQQQNIERSLAENRSAAAIANVPASLAVAPPPMTSPLPAALGPEQPAAVGYGSSSGEGQDRSHLPRELELDGIVTEASEPAPELFRPFGPPLFPPAGPLPPARSPAPGRASTPAPAATRKAPPVFNW